MKKQIGTTGLLVFCMAMMCACSNEVNELQNNEPVELKISPTLTMTRGVVSGTDATKIPDGIKVYAKGTGYGATPTIYTYSSSWSSVTPIYLSNSAATIYGFHPTDATFVAATPAIEVSTMPGADDDASTITVASDNTASVNALANEKDYLWAKASSTVTNASNVATLDFNHGMAMVSFRIYKKDYVGEGKLTKIILKNGGSGSVLTKPGTSGKATMSLENGTITITSGEAVTYIRKTKTQGSEHYVLKEASQTESTTATSPAFSLMVYPVATIAADNIKAEFEIDGKTYTIDLFQSTGTNNAAQWDAGKNYIYSIVMNGKGLGVTITLQGWSSQSIGGNGFNLV